jgi:hypothetical protein
VGARAEEDEARAQRVLHRLRAPAKQDLAVRVVLKRSTMEEGWVKQEEHLAVRVVLWGEGR